jgi:hypothetical protein
MRGGVIAERRQRLSALEHQGQFEAGMNKIRYSAQGMPRLKSIEVAIWPERRPGQRTDCVHLSRIEKIGASDFRIVVRGVAEDVPQREQIVDPQVRLQRRAAIAGS